MPPGFHGAHTRPMVRHSSAVKFTPAVDTYHFHCLKNQRKIIPDKVRNDTISRLKLNRTHFKNRCVFRVFMYTCFQTNVNRSLSLLISKSMSRGESEPLSGNQFFHQAQLKNPHKMQNKIQYNKNAAQRHRQG